MYVLERMVGRSEPGSQIPGRLSDRVEAISNLGSSGRTLKSSGGDSSKVGAKDSSGSSAEDELRELRMQVKQLKERNAVLQFSTTPQQHPAEDVPLSKLFREQAALEQARPPREVFIDQQLQVESGSRSQFDIHVGPRRTTSQEPQQRRTDREVIVDARPRDNFAQVPGSLGVAREIPLEYPFPPHASSGLEYSHSTGSSHAPPPNQLQHRGQPPREEEEDSEYKAFLLKEMQRLGIYEEELSMRSQRRGYRDLSHYAPPSPLVGGDDRSSAAYAASHDRRHHQNNCGVSQDLHYPGYSPSFHQQPVRDRRGLLTRDWGEVPQQRLRRQRGHDTLYESTHNRGDDGPGYSATSSSNNNNNSRDDHRKPPPEPQTAATTKTVEISPGHTKELRGASETTIAIEAGWFVIVDCFACESALQCVADCEMVLCPECHTISPNLLESIAGGAVPLEENSKHGVGLGLNVSERKEEILAKQCS